MDVTRRNFVTALAATSVAGSAAIGAYAEVPRKRAIPQFERNSKNEPIFTGQAGDLRVKFLGTGAADWQPTGRNGPKPDGEWRRRSSVLLDGRILIDFTAQAFDMLGGAKPEIVFYTHQHSDHYDAPAALKAGVKRAYVHKSWHEHAAKQFKAFAAKLGKPAPEVIGIDFFEKVEFDGYVFTLLPANHCCDRPEWLAGVYAIRKGVTHLYYATDTAYCNDRAWCFYVMKEPPFTAIIHESTLNRKDTRISGHSSIDMVEYLVESLYWRGFYTPPAGRKVYLTHLSRNSHPPHAEIAAGAADPLVPAHDGLEVVL